MSRDLRISVQLLTRQFHGVRGAEGREWPPSPFRLFQAMLAGCRMGRAMASWSAERAKAFEWLEGRPAPRIVAPRVDERNWYRTAVPNNDMDIVARQWARGTHEVGAAAKLKTMKEVWPQEVCPDRPAFVHYIWNVPSADDEPHAREIVEAARHVLALGHGEDLAAGDGAIVPHGEALLEGQQWSPSGTGAMRLRTPVRGSLRSLEQRHASFEQRIRGTTINVGLPAALHGDIAYATLESLAPRPNVAFVLTSTSGTAMALPARRIHVASGLVRHAAITAAHRDMRPAGWIETFVAGHGDGDQRSVRFSYLPLPSIGHEKTDGAIRRVIVAVPAGSDPAPIWWAAERMDGAPLVDEASGRVVGTLLAAPAHDTVVERYLRCARRWATVTPVILPGHDDRRRGKTEALFLRALRQAGLEHAVKTFSIRREPFWPSTHHSRDYDVPPYLRGYARWHAELSFREAVVGPIAIGGGRHLGFGLLATDL